MFDGILSESMLYKAQKKDLVKIELINLRDFGIGKRKTVDDTPYGGGPGMIIRADIVDRALRDLKCKVQNTKCKIILLTPRGKIYNQKIARRLAKLDEIVLICGHYEGVDERIKDLVDEEISIGEYVLTGGEPAAAVIVDSVTRLIPGVLGDENSAKDESYSKGKNLEYPQYTRPAEFRGKKVPKILLSGNHQKIADWRKGKSK